jgi:ribosomal protein S18 acetylase RimI-like enzyme
MNKVKITLQEFIREQLEKLDGFSTNVDGYRFELIKDGEVIGSTMFSQVIKNAKFNNQPHISLWGFMIKEQYRGEGYSKILMKKVLEFLKDSVDIVDLQVMEHNKPAVNLYKSFGFEIYNNTGHGVLYMSKKL